MDMRKMESLYDKLCKEWDNVADKELSANMLDALHKLTGTIHYLDEMMESEDEYSGESYRNGSRGRGGNRSYRGSSYNDGSYRRGQPRDRMGRYSGEYSREGDFRSELEAMMRDAPDERTREAMRQMMQNMG